MCNGALSREHVSEDANKKDTGPLQYLEVQEAMGDQETPESVPPLVNRKSALKAMPRNSPDLGESTSDPT
jgi:hypothetical protein